MLAHHKSPVTDADRGLLVKALHHAPTSDKEFAKVFTDLKAYLKKFNLDTSLYLTNNGLNENLAAISRGFFDKRIAESYSC